MAGNNETFTYGIQITADSSGAVKSFTAGGNSAEKFAASLGELDKKSGKSGKQFKKASGDVNRLQISLREAAASAALVEGPLGGVAGRLSALSAVAGRSNVALAGIGIGIAGASFTAQKSIGTWAETEHQMAQLESQLTLTGHAVGFTSEQLDEMARNIAWDTLADTKDIREAMGVMLTFTSITGDAFEGAIKASNNLAQIMGGSTKAAAIQLGKALEDPRVGLTALRRSGVSFTTEQRALIISLVDTGEKTQAMTEVLKVLDTQLPDASDGVGQLKGSFDSLGQSVTELMESIGKNSTLEGFALSATKWATDLAKAAKNIIDPSDEALRNKLLVERLALVNQLAVQGRRQGENGIVRQIKEIDKQLDVFDAKRQADNKKLAKGEAGGEAGRLQKELDAKNKLRIANSIKETVIRTRTLEQSGAAAAKIQKQQLDESLANELISIEQHGQRVTALKLAQNQREVDSLKERRKQLDNEEATPIVKFRADENILRKENERITILKQGELDLANARKKAADDRAKLSESAAKREQDALKTLNAAQISLLKSTGDYAEASQKEITARYATMLANLKGESRTAGQEIVNSLIDNEAIKIALSKMEKQVSDELNEMNRRETSIDVSVNTGVLTDYDSRQKVLDIHKDTADALDEVLERMKAVAAISNNPNLGKGIKDLQSKIEQLRGESSLLEVHTRDVLGAAFSDVFAGIGKDINSAGDAFKAFTLSVLDSIAQIAAKSASQALTNAAVSGLGKIFSFHTGGGNLTGRTGKPIAVNPMVFHNAPRFHGGLKADEFPAILQTGEDVVSRSDPRNSRNGGGGGEASRFNITVPVTIEGGDNDQKKVQGISALVKTAITQALVKEKRPGGLLS